MGLSCAAAAAAAVLLLQLFICAETYPDSSARDALWRRQCSNVQEVYVVQHGDTPNQLMVERYPGMPWEPMWALVALCNSKALAAFNPAQEGTAKISEGLTLNLPVFQLPGTTSTATSHTAVQQQQQNTQVGTAAQSRTADKQGQANPATDNRSGAASGGSSSSAQTPNAWVSSAVCGCGEQITNMHPSSWLQLVQQAYPNTPHMQMTALLLSLCNPNAALTANMLLQPGQQLVGICAETTATITNAAAAAASPGQPQRSNNSSVGSSVPPTGSLLASTTSSAGSTTAEIATAAARRRRRAAVPLQQYSEEELYCSVTTLSGYGGHLRQVAVQPEAECPWYADECSGPTEGLQYQDVLKPCCNAHDYCYLCSYRLGWSGKDGRKSCDHLMLSNMLKACEGSFPINGWWDWKAKWHKFWCDSTANVMFAAVWAYQEMKGGTVHEHMQCPGDYSSFLAAADFCFYR